ncbi:Metal tolerance protein 10 [Camellia lanceoleosa]|uniref:Metal tolerance protein 10 n=1 Tax=Camellia lanceoleosa TaxID=1840588 RepID=A0ACC0HEH0_9ERIC|nr:Metal tolerance protein 10 [Camellia lanceoleosa]
MMMGEKDTRSSTPTGTRGNGEIQDSSSRRELLDMDMDGEQSSSSWRLDVKQFTVPQQRPPSDHHLLHHRFRRLLRYPRKQGKIAEYYKKQEILLEGFTEMETMNESGCLAGNPTEDEMKQLAKSERTAIYVSNVANLVLFVAKVYASYESRSLAVIASTLDSLRPFTWVYSVVHFPCHEKAKPVSLSNWKEADATSGKSSNLPSYSIQGLVHDIGKQLQTAPERNLSKEKWMIGIMVSVTFVKFALMVYCRRFKNEIVRAYAQDHLFDVITNSVGLVTAVLAVRYYWWIDPTGAIIIALYTITTWTRTVLENVGSLIGRTAPPDFLAKLTYLIWNHHEEIKHIDTVRAYTFGSHYFVEVDIVLPEDMLLSQAHNIGEKLQEKLEQLPEVERAFVHIDFEFTHAPEHKSKV